MSKSQKNRSYHCKTHDIVLLPCFPWFLLILVRLMFLPNGIYVVKPPIPRLHGCLQHLGLWIYASNRTSFYLHQCNFGVPTDWSMVGLIGSIPIGSIGKLKMEDFVKLFVMLTFFKQLWCLEGGMYLGILSHCGTWFAAGARKPILSSSLRVRSLSPLKT